jgi:hypothetical protein
MYANILPDRPELAMVIHARIIHLAVNAFERIRDIPTYKIYHNIAIKGQGLNDPLELGWVPPVYVAHLVSQMIVETALSPMVRDEIYIDRTVPRVVCLDRPATDQDCSWTFAGLSLSEKFGNVSQFSHGGVHQSSLFRI